MGGRGASLPVGRAEGWGTVGGAGPEGRIPPTCVALYQLADACFAFLRPHVLAVDIHAGMDVVEQVPTRMVGIFVNDEVITAGPAPVRAERPIPIRDLKIETAGKPEAVKAGVEPGDSVPVAWPEMREVAVLKRMIEVEPRIVRGLVAVKRVVVNVRRVVSMPRGQFLWRARLTRIRSCRGCRWNMPLVRARRIG